MSYGYQSRSAKKAFVAILLTPLALFAVADMFMVYYQGVGLLPPVHYLLRLGIHSIAVLVALRYIFIAWWFLRTRRIMRFQRAYSMHATNLVTIGKRVTKMPSPLELMAFLMMLTVLVSALHVVKEPSAPFYFLLMVPAIVFYPVVEALLLARWKNKALQNA